MANVKKNVVRTISFSLVEELKKEELDASLDELDVADATATSSSEKDPWRWLFVVVAAVEE